MIYTSYFAKLKSLPDNIVPISICAKAPDWYKGLEFKGLAPKYDFFIKYKNDHDSDYFTKCYNARVLSNYNASILFADLLELVNNCEKDICLMCYEKPSDFCHRHLVADWFNKNGIKCKEYEF